MPVDWSSPDISEPLLDVSVEDTINKSDKAATVAIDDAGGDAIADYPRGTAITLQVTGSNVTDLDRFSGWVSGNNQQDGRVELSLNAFDHWLFQTFSQSFDNESIANILRSLITNYTPIEWQSSQVSITDNRTYTRDWRGATINQAIAELSQLSGGEQFGVDNSNVFFFEPEAQSSAPRNFVDGEYYDHNAEEDHRVEVNKVIVYYGQGEDRRKVEVEDSSSQQEYGSNMGVTGGVTTRLSKYYPTISDEDVAKDKAQTLLDQNSNLRSIELKTWEAFDVYPNQSTRIVIPEHNIDSRFQIAYIGYDWLDDSTTIRAVENSEGILDFVKKSREETTRIDHKNVAASGDPKEEDQSPSESGGQHVTNPSVLEKKDMSDGETRSYRDYVKQGQRFELLSAGVINDTLDQVSGLTASVINESDGSTVHSTEAKRVDGTPLAEKSGPADLRFELENATGGSQTGVSGRWVYRVVDLFQPDTWMFQVGPRNLGTTELTSVFDSNPAEKWAASTSSDIFSSPHIGSDTAYVGTDGGDVRAYALSDGSQRWSFSTGGTVRSSPALHNGTVFVGSDDGNVYALDADDGSERWRVSTGGSVRSSPAVASGVVFVGSDDNSVYALDTADGSQQWTYPTGGRVRSSPAVADGTVYVGSDDNIVYALDGLDGSEIWTYSTGGAVDVAPTVEGGGVYVGSNDNTLYALDAADGTELWTFASGGSVSAAAAVVDGAVYFGTGVVDDLTSTLYALSASDGSAEWSALAGGPGIRAAPAVLGGQVVAGCGDGTVRGFTTTDGSEQWSYDTGAATVSTSPAVRDGVVFVGTP